jgi:hypothetical protein
MLAISNIVRSDCNYTEISDKLEKPILTLSIALLRHQQHYLVDIECSFQSKAITCLAYINQCINTILYTFLPYLSQVKSDDFLTKTSNI